MQNAENVVSKNDMYNYFINAQVCNCLYWYVTSFLPVSADYRENISVF